eukprot:scaffold285584_cov34-Prasinocladus_malaysianus.AAC.1
MVRRLLNRGQSRANTVSCGQRPDACGLTPLRQKYVVQSVHKGLVWEHGTVGEVRLPAQHLALSKAIIRRADGHARSCAHSFDSVFKPFVPCTQ